MKQHKDTASATPVRRGRFTRRMSFRLEPELETRFKRAAIRDSQTWDGGLRRAVQLYIMDVESRIPDKQS